MSNQSTGPRTEEGKARSAQNATKHGLRSERPVLPTEDAAAWDAFRADVVSTLEPANTMERKLAERVALQMWRQDRAARYEVEVCSDAYENGVADGVDAMHGVDGDGQTMAAMIEIEKDINLRAGQVNAARSTLATAEALAALPFEAAVDADDAFFLLMAAGGKT